MFVVLVSTILAGLTVSYSASVRVQALGANEDGRGLKAELAAESGMDYARRRLLIDSQWRGTDPGGIQLADGSRFEVVVIEASGPVMNLNISSTGFHNDGRAKLDAQATFTGPGGVSDKAIICLGGEVDMDHVYGWGDVVITDELDVVYDWVVDGQGRGAWVMGGATTLGSFTFDLCDVYGTLIKYTDTQYLGPPAIEQEITKAQYMPSWDLDSYLTPRPGLRVVHNPPAMVQNINTEDTVVLVMPEYSQIRIKNCYIGGGLVIWAPQDWDTRGIARNRVKFMAGSEIGGGNLGAETTVGLIAPATEIVATHAPEIRGFNLWHSLLQWAHGNLWGQTFIINEVQNFAHACFWYDAQVALNLPPGIVIGGGAPTIDIGQVTEAYN